MKDNPRLWVISANPGRFRAIQVLEEAEPPVAPGFCHSERSEESQGSGVELLSAVRAFQRLRFIPASEANAAPRLPRQEVGQAPEAAGPKQAALR